MESILNQFEQEARARFEEHAQKVDIHFMQITRMKGLVIFKMNAYLDNKLARGEGNSMGEVIDRCIESLALYTNDKPRVTLNDRYKRF